MQFEALRNFYEEKCGAAFSSYNRGNSVSPQELAIAAKNRATMWQNQDFRESLVNDSTNTIPTELKRDFIFQGVVEDFGRKIIPLTLFSTKFEDVPLQGTDKMQIPYYDLDAGASTSFNSATGYTTSNTTTAVREIRIGKRDDADTADNTKQYDRKYQALAVSSQEIARQPMLNIIQLMKLKTDKLVSDITAHILGIVTAAKFGAAVKTEDASTFDSDDVIDVKLACKLWDTEGRILILNSDFDAALMKDDAFKAAYAAGSDKAIKEGKLFPRVMGFDYSEFPTLPENGENLVGMAAFRSAIGIGFAAVMPAEEVRNSGTKWKMYVDPTSGAVLEARSFGNPQLDSATHLVESSYGFDKINGNALKRICKP